MKSLFFISKTIIFCKLRNSLHSNGSSNKEKHINKTTQSLENKKVLPNKMYDNGHILQIKKVDDPLYLY